MKTLLRCLALAALLLVSGHAGAQKPFVAHPPNAGVEKTFRLGSNWGKPFDDFPGDGSVLIGFVAYCGPHDKYRILVGLEPIYLGPAGRALGVLRGVSTSDTTTIEAKPGYAVSGLGSSGGGVVDGLEVFFMRILPGADGLDPSDFYVSEWFGGHDYADREIRYAGNNCRLALGFHGRADKEFNALGLIQAAPASLDAPPMKTIAADDASNYEASWEGAPPKGTGFGPWIFASSDRSRTNAGFGIGTSTANGLQPPSGGVDRAGKSWMMHASPGHAATAVRTFSGGPLRPGQQFCLQMDNGDLKDGGTVGFSLQNAAGADLFEFFYRGGGRDYRLRCNNAEAGTGIQYCADGLNLAVTLLAGNQALFDIRTGCGQFAAIPCVLTGGDISQVKLYCRKAGPDLANTAFWNGLVIRQSLPPGPDARPAAAR